MVDFDTKTVNERQKVLRWDNHVRAQTEKVMEILRSVKGINHSSFSEVVDHVALSIAILEADPECQQTANFGGVTVARGPMEGYSIHVHVTDVYVMHLDKYEPKRWHPWRPGKIVAKES